MPNGVTYYIGGKDNCHAARRRFETDTIPAQSETPD